MTILTRIGSSSKETTEIGEASGMSLHNTRAEVEVVVDTTTGMVDTEVAGIIMVRSAFKTYHKLA